MCGTWYLPHSQVHNERTVPIIMTGCITHARNGQISTSALKSDVTIVFLDPDFLQDAKSSAIRVHLRHLYHYLIFVWVFRTSWPKRGTWGQNMGRSGAILTPWRTSFPLRGFASVPILMEIDQEMRPWECPQTDTHTDRLTDWHTDWHTQNRFYNLSHAICYSYRTDNNDSWIDEWPKVATTKRTT